MDATIKKVVLAHKFGWTIRVKESDIEKDMEDIDTSTHSDLF